jgi:hypothetical protein
MQAEGLQMHLLATHSNLSQVVDTLRTEHAELVDHALALEQQLKQAMPETAQLGQGTCLTAVLAAKPEAHGDGMVGGSAGVHAFLCTSRCPIHSANRNAVMQTCHDMQRQATHPACCM